MTAVGGLATVVTAFEGAPPAGYRRRGRSGGGHCRRSSSEGSHRRRSTADGKGDTAVRERCQLETLGGLNYVDTFPRYGDT